MPASEIVRIATTVGAIQLLCDMVAYYQVFSGERYIRCVEKMNRSAFTVQNLQTKKTEKSVKKLKRAQDDHSINTANVTRLHMIPNLIISAIFLILMRVMGLDLRGKIVAILPFAPFSLLGRLSGRGLEFDEHMVSLLDESETNITVNQAVSFTFVYMLATMSIKYYVHQIFGEFPPHNADSVMGLLDTPMARKTLESYGLDPDEYKTS